MSNDVIQVKNLYKSYGQTKAVDDLSLNVKKGELFAFLGVNGAGKSTTISIICGTLNKDSGTILINGKNVDSHRQEIKKYLGVVFQNSVLDKSLTVYDNLQSRASLYGIFDKKFKDRVAELDELLDLKDILHRTIGKLSGGQRRKIDIARALLHEPEIVILDEPTTGLDPQTRTKIWSALNKLKEQKQMTVFLTTHYMEEASDADYVVIIDGGKTVAEGTPHQLKNTYTGDFLYLYDAKEEEIAKLNLPYDKIGNAHRISINNTQQATALITTYPEIFRDYEITKGKMDSVFLNVTGKNLTEESK